MAPAEVMAFPAVIAQKFNEHKIGHAQSLRGENSRTKVRAYVQKSACICTESAPRKSHGAAWTMTCPHVRHAVDHCISGGVVMVTYFCNRS